MNAYDVIVKPVLSEKGYAGIANKVYTFIVYPTATKTDIKLAVESIFSVKVDKVNTAKYDGKIKRMGKNSGRTPAYKKAIVTLAKDSKSIEFFESLS